MKLGIVGLPNVGKSTLFNAITNAGAEAANYPFCTIEPNVGVVTVPDPRLDALAKMHTPDKVTAAVVEFVDIAGLVRGASKGEGLGNQFLSHIREVDAIVHVVRCFEDENVIHVEGHVDPIADVETVNTELVLSDMEAVEKRLDKARKMMKGDRALAPEVALLERIYETLCAGKPVHTMEFDKTEAELLAAIPLLSAKPVIYAANIGEDDIGTDLTKQPLYAALAAYAKEEGAGILPVCASMEAEIAQLDSDEKQIFMEELGIAESGLDRLIRESYSLLGLISFLTAGKPEVRAWTIRRGTKAPQAAGKIHSDIERGFIRAEVIAFDDLMRVGTMAAAREKGMIRSEGKDYVMQDGDIVLFRFNV